MASIYGTPERIVKWYKCSLPKMWAPEDERGCAQSKPVKFGRLADGRPVYFQLWWTHSGCPGDPKRGYSAMVSVFTRELREDKVLWVNLTGYGATSGEAITQAFGKVPQRIGLGEEPPLPGDLA